MQPFSHHSEQILACIERYPEDAQPTLHALRDFILAFDDRIGEFYKYKSPTYSIRKGICFLHVDTKSGVPYVGFVNGKTIEAEFPEVADFLSFTDQKFVRWFKAPVGEEIDFEKLGVVLEKAVLLSE